MIHHIEIQVLGLLLVAAVVAIAARRWRVPYTLALVVAGLFLGFLNLESLSGVELKPDLLLMILLPALLFEAAFHIVVADFRRNLVPILTLAVPGVLVAVSATAGLLYLGLGMTGLVPDFGWQHALLFASVIAATDPISVLALFRSLGVSRRLYLIVEGESLLNDGVAVVVFTIVISVVGLGGGHSDVHLEGVTEIASFGLMTFLRMAVGGALVGALVGGAISALTRQIDERLIETSLTMLVAYGSFLIAEQVECSGVISTVVAGIVMGSVGAKYGMSPATKNAVEDYWEHMAFLANSFIFLLVGLELHVGELFGNAAAVGVAFVAVVAARALMVYGGVPLANLISTPIPKAWRHVMVWGGLRGSLSMVLIVTLPADFAGRATLVSLVFGVVAISLFVQGLTTGPLLSKLGLLKGHNAQHLAYERARIHALASRRGLMALESLREDGQLEVAPYTRLKRWYVARLEDADARCAANAGEDTITEQLAEGVRRLADVERATVRAALQAEIVTSDVAEEIDRELHARLAVTADAESHGEADLQRCVDRILAQTDGSAEEA